MFGTEVDCVDEETYFTTKITKKNTNGTKQIAGRDRKPKEYLCFLCSSLCFLWSPSAQSIVVPNTTGQRVKEEKKHKLLIYFDPLTL